MPDGFGEEGKALDHHQGAQAAQYRADHQAGEQCVDHETVGQCLGQVASAGPFLDQLAECFIAHQVRPSLRGWTENRLSRRSGVRA
ncbi:hypothetical protein D3C81_1932930 [compost metagenome]